MKWLSEGSASTRTRVTHLTEAMPNQPGTIARSGAPWSAGIGSPFMRSASSTSCIAFSIGMLRRKRGTSGSGAWSAVSNHT